MDDLKEEGMDDRDVSAVGLMESPPFNDEVRDARARMRWLPFVTSVSGCYRLLNNIQPPGVLTPVGWKYCFRDLYLRLSAGPTSNLQPPTSRFYF